MIQFDNIVDLFVNIAAKVDVAMWARAVDPFHVYFDYGTEIEVIRNLTSLDQGTTTKGKKYPIIWLVGAFREHRGDLNFPLKLPRLQIFIATRTEIESTYRKRINANFKPRLYPIYNELLYQICISGYFTVTEVETVPHDKIDFPFYGGQEELQSGRSNILNDYIDCIKIMNLELMVNEDVSCLT